MKTPRVFRMKFQNRNKRFVLSFLFFQEYKKKMKDYLLQCQQSTKISKKYYKFVCPYCLMSYKEAKMYSLENNLSPYFCCTRCESYYPDYYLREEPIWKIIFCCFLA